MFLAIVIASGFKYLGTLLIGAILGYAFRGKEHAAIADVGAAIKKDVSTAASDVAKKV